MTFPFQLKYKPLDLHPKKTRAIHKALTPHEKSIKTSKLLVKQKAKLHRKSGQSESGSDPSVLGWIFEKFVLAMILYFVVSIVNSLAQSYHKRLHKKKTTTKQH